MLQDIEYGKMMNTNVTMKLEDEIMNFFYYEGPLVTIKKIENGIYQTDYASFEYLLGELSDHWIKDEMELVPIDGKLPFGICDNAAQVLEYIPNLKENKEKYIITVTPVYKKDQPEKDGFRWDNKGIYIGTQKLEHEFLYDEPEVEMVMIFHVYRVEKKEK